jgi:hypothetical protein
MIFRMGWGEYSTRNKDQLSRKPAPQKLLINLNLQFDPESKGAIINELGNP